MHILIIEDEEKVAQAVREGLENAGYHVEIATTGEEGLVLLYAKRYNLLLLDMMLPGYDGLEILRRIRNRKLEMPVLILTARDTVEDKVTGLDNGADDYLVKPFAFAELLARIRVLLRRQNQEELLHYHLADLEMDLLTRTVSRAGQIIALTNREFDLLEYLLRNRDQIVSREMLARDVWQEPNRFSPIDNVIDVHITRLRHKIDEPYRIKLLHTVRGIGFIVSEKNPNK